MRALQPENHREKKLGLQGAGPSLVPPIITKYFIIKEVMATPYASIKPTTPWLFECNNFELGTTTGNTGRSDSLDTLDEDSGDRTEKRYYMADSVKCIVLGFKLLLYLELVVSEIVRMQRILVFVRKDTWII
jgi:hypothetical protein